MGEAPPANYLLAADSARPSFGPMNASLPRQSSLPTVAIVGAGFTGLSTAYHLAQLNRERGERFRVILLERGFVASGPSGQSAGHVCGLQASDAKVLRHCGEALGRRLVAHAGRAADHVRTLAATFGPACDLRDGYVSLLADGRQEVSRGGEAFSIAPYPFALAMSAAAVWEGVALREHCPVAAIEPTGEGFTLATPAGPLHADHVIACAGTGMAFEIDLLAPLWALTIELNVGTILTEPVPPDILDALFPDAPGERFAFADWSANVAYGSIGRDGRILFGACASPFGQPSPRAMARRLGELLPGLEPRMRATTGRPLAWRTLLDRERLSFSRNTLPNVGRLADHVRIRYVNGLGGHGLALGCWIGKGIAESLRREDIPDALPIFEDFAAIPHRRLPVWQPGRMLACAAGLALAKRGCL